MLRGKAAVIGSGLVGSSTAYTLMVKGMFAEIVIIDINREKAEGDALDIAHGVSFCKPVNVRAGDWSDCRDADIVIITAGAAQEKGERRLDLLKRNTVIVKSVIDNIMKYVPDDVFLLIVTNPVDILTYSAYKYSGLKKSRVLGSGTVLDTARLKYMISKRCGVDARNCHTYIIGEHGDSEVAAWSVTNIGGMSMGDFCRFSGKCSLGDLDTMYNEVKNSAYEIIRKKGSTYYAIAAAVTRICECIAGDENSILTVSSIFDGQYGISDIALSVPTKVGGAGIENILEVPFSDDEIAGLLNSAKTLQKLTREIGL